MTPKGAIPSWASRVRAHAHDQVTDASKVSPERPGLDRADVFPCFMGCLRDYVTDLSVEEGVSLPVSALAHNPAFEGLRRLVSSDATTLCRELVDARCLEPAAGERARSTIDADMFCLLGAPFEADAQLSYLEEHGFTDGTLSEDSDTFFYEESKNIYSGFNTRSTRKYRTIINRTTVAPYLSEIHGHSFRAEVTVRGTPDPNTGMVVDLGLLERAMAEVQKTLDHKFLNRIEAIGVPTLENLSRFIWERLQHAGKLTRVSVHRDSCNESCTYFGPQG